MYGQGIAKGLWVTFKHFLNTYVDDIRYECGEIRRSSLV